MAHASEFPSRHAEILRADLHTFRLPFELPDFAISLLWHPRMEGDQAHRWLRETVAAVCAPGRAGARSGPAGRSSS